jgi:hypothetical protein
MSNELEVITVDESSLLPDNTQWENRFEIRSETSERLYTIAQHKTKRHWGCSCPAWRIRRKCKHLEALNLAPYEQPQEITVKCA